MLARDDAGRLCGAVPLYLKTNSYGEFIFDWSWANAAQRSGLSYYPKLVAAIPFTPATGRRLPLVDDPAVDAAAVRSALLGGVRALADAEGASSVAASISTAEPCEPTGIRAVSIDGNDAVIVVFGAGAGAGAAATTVSDAPSGDTVICME